MEVIHTYYCHSCDEEVSVIGLKSTCPYCKSKSPHFQLADSDGDQPSFEKNHGIKKFFNATSTIAANEVKPACKSAGFFLSRK